MSSTLHKNNFNFLRIVFASMVILSHSFELLDGNRVRELLTRVFHTISFGELGVDGFFILSGYLIAQSWQRNPKLWDFLVKRFLRIYPGYVVALLISMFVVGALGARDWSHYLQQIRFAFVRDALLLRHVVTPPTFVQLPYQAVNNSLWTIKYEVRCYLLLAVLGFCGLFKNRVFTFLLFVGFVSVYSYECRHIGLLLIQGSFLRLASFFLCGVCFHLFSDCIRYTRTGTLLAAVTLIGCMFHPLLSQIALLTVGAYVLFSAAFAQCPPLQQFGRRADVSYGAYLYAWPITTLLLWQTPTISPWLLFALTWVLSIACGIISWYAIEQPFLRMKPRSRVEQAALPPDEQATGRVEGSSSP